MASFGALWDAGGGDASPYHPWMYTAISSDVTQDQVQWGGVTKPV